MPPKTSSPKANEVNNEKTKHVLALSGSVTFFLLVGARVLSAIFNPSVISDCDEVMNYWEPTHFLIYGKGFQTWEYSPVYTLRSYAYISIQATVGYFLSLLFEPIVVFYGIRVAFGLFCAACEFVFVLSVKKRFGSEVASFSTLFLAFSPGMFIASTAYLPSSFSMYFLILGFAGWFSENYILAVSAVVAATLLGWPFCVVLTIPLALHVIWRAGFFKTFAIAVVSSSLLLVPCILIDYYFYHKWVIAVLHIIIYNVFSSKGPDLYGVEPWSYYLFNSFANFNFIFVLALVSLPFLLAFKAPRTSKLHLVVYLLPFYIWFGLMSRMSHKEERFLYPIYHLICLGGAFSLTLLNQQILLFLQWLVPSKVPTFEAITRVLIKGMLLCIALLSLSRIVGMHTNYNAPLQIYTQFYHAESQMALQSFPTDPIRVCVGKEWYRFPSHFFFPSSQFELQFVRSNFTGQLPKMYHPINSTWIIPTDMNDENKEEPSRYVDVSTCHYFVDFEFEGQSEIQYSRVPNWETVLSFPFLDSAKSPSPFRAFYIPVLSQRKNVFGNYSLFRNKDFFQNK